MFHVVPAFVSDEAATGLVMVEAAVEAGVRRLPARRSRRHRRRRGRLGDLGEGPEMASLYRYLVAKLGSSALANPDIVTRLPARAALNSSDPSTFYGGDARGYTDYPALAARNLRR